MNNFIIFSVIFLVIFSVFILTLRSFLSQLLIRMKIKKGIRTNKSEIRKAKGNNAQLFEIYKRVYNFATYNQSKFLKTRNKQKFEQKVNNELNRMIKNPFTILISLLFSFTKGFLSFIFLLLSIFFGAIVVDEFKASSLTLPTINTDVNLKLNINLEDKFDDIFTNIFVQTDKLRNFNFPKLSNDNIIPIYKVKDYPSTVTNVEQLGQGIAHYMSKFENQFTVYYQGNTTNFEQILNDVYNWLDFNEPYLWAIRGESYFQFINYGSYIELQVTMNYDLTAEQHAIVLGKIKQIINTMPSNLTEEEKVKFVNDFLVTHTKYNLNSNANPHTPYSILINGEGVCEGYALTALLMLETLGIETKYIVGEAISGGLHAWNLVKVNNQWYHLDVTWNDPIPDQGKSIRYEYFLITDKKISKDHLWIESNYPESATKDFF